MGNICILSAKVSDVPYYTNSDEIYFSHLGLTANDLEKFAKVRYYLYIRLVYILLLTCLLKIDFQEV